MEVSSAKYPIVPLKNKIESYAKTEYATISGGDVVVKTSKATNNIDAVISSNGITKIESPQIVNKVTIDESNPIAMRDGKEILSWDRNKRLFGKTTYPTEYQRVMENKGVSYNTGQPSIIEGNTLIIDTNNIVGEKYKEGQGATRLGNIDVVKNIEDLEKVKESRVILLDNTNLLDVSNLYKEAKNPSSKYILEMRSPYITRENFYGGEYFLTRVGFNENWDRIRLLGDAYYENLLIEKTLTEKLGTRYINGLSGSTLIKKLIDNSVVEKENLGLQQGLTLTKKQINNLKNDIIWYEYETVNGILSLVPKVYLSENTLNTLNTNDRSKIYGTNYTLINVDGTLQNDSLQIGKDKSVTILKANEVRNNEGLIKGQQVRVEALKGNIENIGGSIVSEDRLELVANNGNIENETTKEKRSENYETTKDVGVILGQDVKILANTYNSKGAVLKSDELELNVDDVALNTLELVGEDSYRAKGRLQNYKAKENISSEIETNKLSGNIKNINVNGSNLIAENTAGLVVAGNVDVTSEKNVYDTKYYANDRGILSKESTNKGAHTEQNVASNVKLGQNAVIIGNVNVVGSNVSLGDNTYVGGKVTTDSKELNNTYYEEHKKRGFSSNVSPTSVRVGYEKSKTTYDEKSITNAKSNLEIGNNVTLNNGAEIVATDLQHGSGIVVNNGDVIFGARKDSVDIKQTSKNSFIGVSASINSPALDRVKQGKDAINQIKEGDILGGSVNVANAITGTISGLAGNQGKRQTSKNKRDVDKAKANNDFYVGASANIGLNSSKKESTSHEENTVISTIQGKNENSNITFNNQKNVTYKGTEAKNTTLVYNNVENVTKEAVEVNNSYNSSYSSKGIGVSSNISFSPDLNKLKDGVKNPLSNSKNNNSDTDLFKANSVSTSINLSESGSNQNTTETIYKNGNFEDVKEVHNNTQNMRLDGFNQEGGVVRGSIKNLEISSKQNKSETKGNSYGVNVGINTTSLTNSSVNINKSKTKGKKNFVDNQSSFVVGQGSNLVIENTTNTAGIIGTEENAKLEIDNYVGKNLENEEKLKTDEISVGSSGLGYNYSHKERAGITRNTVIGNVEIEKSSGDEINRDLSKANEITKEKESATNVNVESQTIGAVLKPEEFREKVDKAIQEIKDITTVISDSINNKGEDKRNPIELLNEQRRATTMNNIVADNLNNLQILHKNKIIDDEQFEKGLERVVETLGSDLGLNIDVRFTDDSTKMPKDSKTSTGAAYIVTKSDDTHDIYIDRSKINETSQLIGVMFEEVSHVLDGVAGRQDIEVVEGTSGEYGLESLGKATGEYFKNQYKENSEEISLNKDNIDYSEAEIGSIKVGDKSNNGLITLLFNFEGMGITDLNGRNFSNEYVEQQLKSIFGFKVNWKEYDKNSEYREMIKYYFYQAVNSLRVKKLGTPYLKNGNTYIDIVQENNSKMTLKQVPESESIFHNLTYKNNELAIRFVNLNRKYIQDDGYELIVDSTGKWLGDRDIKNRGSYNVATYENLLSFDVATHISLDIELWIKYGTAPPNLDKTTKKDRERVGRSLGLDIKFFYDYYKKEALSKGGVLTITELEKLGSYQNLIKKIRGSK